MTYQDISRRNKRLYAALERSSSPALAQQIKCELEVNLDKLCVMLKTADIEKPEKKKGNRCEVIDNQSGIKYASVHHAALGTGVPASTILYRFNRGTCDRFTVFRNNKQQIKWPSGR